jgi:hypothetical protein
LPKLVEAWERGADLVLGTRAHLFAAMSRVRRASNGTSSWLISQVAGADLPDCQTGYRPLYESVDRGRSGFPSRVSKRRAPSSSAPCATASPWPACRSAWTRRTAAPTSHYRPLVDSLRIAGAVTRARLESQA